MEWQVFRSCLFKIWFTQLYLKSPNVTVCLLPQSKRTCSRVFFSFWFSGFGFWFAVFGFWFAKFWFLIRGSLVSDSRDFSFWLAVFSFWFSVSDSRSFVSDSRILVPDSRDFWFLIRGILVSDSRILVSDSRLLVSDSLFLIRGKFLIRGLFLFRDLNFQKWSEHLVFLTCWLPNVLRATTACTFSTSQLPKVVRNWGVLYILTPKCASRHYSVHFFDIWTSKSGPRMVCFVHFDSKMCFAPLQRPLFRHLNFQKWSENGVLCTFWLRNVIRGTTTCTFLTSELPKVVRSWCVLYILTSKCASRYNGVHFFDVPTSKSGPRMLCFVHFDFEICFALQQRALFRHLNWPAGSAPAALASLLFDPPEPQIIGKTQCFATFLPFLASASSFSLLFLFYSSFF